MCWFFGNTQFYHLAKLFGVISVLIKANCAPGFCIHSVAVEKSKIPVKYTFLNKNMRNLDKRREKTKNEDIFIKYRSQKALQRAKFKN